MDRAELIEVDTLTAQEVTLGGGALLGLTQLASQCLVRRARLAQLLLQLARCTRGQ